MFLQTTKNKIQKLEEQIIRDFSVTCGASCKLPVKFSTPEKLSASSYRVFTEIIKTSDKYYPVGIFAGNVYDGIDGKVAVLNSEYNNLGTVFGTSEGEFLFGIKLPESNARKITDVSEKLYFDLDLKNSGYSLFEQAENQNYIEKC